MKILLTGGTGFIGSHLLEKLLKNTSYNLVVLKRSTSNIFRIEHLLDRLKLYDVDVIDLKEVFLKEKIDGIIHLATYYKKEHDFDDIEHLIQSNVTFPTKLLQLALENNVKFFINTGTFFQYNLYSNPINENNFKEPYNLYASSKSSFDQIIKYFVRKSNINLLTLNLSTPFGFNDNHKLIPFLIKSVLDDKKIVLEKGEQKWDFIYVIDVINAYIKGIELCINSKRTLNEEILIGSSQLVSVKKIGETINQIHGKELITFEKDYETDQIFKVVIDNSKAQNLLQWIPQFKLEDALLETYNLYRNLNR